MPAVQGLGHVGLYVEDLAKMRTFYEETLGLRVTDVVADAGLVFMSARPGEEHHELLLMQRNQDEAGPDRLNQISFRCASLEDVHGFWQQFVERGVPIEMTVSHGNAIGVYFLDPEGNTVEVYWDTGLEARQPWMDHVDLSRSLDDVRAQVEQRVREHGTTGFVGPEFLPPDA